MTECDPCEFCVHANYFYDSGVAIDALFYCSEENFDPEDGEPCPSFRPRYASDDLFYQLEYEAEIEFENRCEKERALC